MVAGNRLKAFISTTQPKKAREFYNNKLGLQILSEDPYGIDFETNGATVRITFVEKLTPQPFTVLGWDTDDIVSTIKFLLDRGITFEKYTFLEQDDSCIWTAPGGTRVAWFKDPDGNLLSVSD